MKSGYFRFVLNRGVRHLFSVFRWVILFKPIEPTNASEYYQVEAGDLVSFRKAEPEDYLALIDVYPDEFAGHLPDSLKRAQLLGRSAAKTPCFVAVSTTGALCGATWCPRNKDPVLGLSGAARDYRVFEMMNTFVVAAYRGKGVGRGLRRFALAEMARRGYTAVISYVWYSRRESLAMNFATGSRILAEKCQVSVMGWRRVYFKHTLALPRLPLAEIPAVVLLGQSKVVVKKVAACFRQWGVKAVFPCIFSDKENGMTLVNRLSSLERKFGVEPIVLCCDQASREWVSLLNHEMEKPRRIISDVRELPFPDDIRESLAIYPDHSMGELLLKMESEQVGLVGFLYLYAIGCHDLVTLWQPTAKIDAEKAVNP